MRKIYVPAQSDALPRNVYFYLRVVLLVVLYHTHRDSFSRIEIYRMFDVSRKKIESMPYRIGASG